MFTQNAPAWAMRGQLVELRAGASSTIGGSRESAANDWHVKPTGAPSSRAVTMVMPVAKWPSTSRNRAWSRPDTRLALGLAEVDRLGFLGRGHVLDRAWPRGAGGPGSGCGRARGRCATDRGARAGGAARRTRPRRAPRRRRWNGPSRPCRENSSSVYWPSWMSRSTSRAELEHRLGDGPAVQRRLVIGHVGDRTPLRLNPEAQGDPAVRDGPGHDLGRADGEVLGT